MDSPTFFLARSPLGDRLWLLVFLEALIAIENRSEEHFEIDYIMAVNEYLIRRSNLSVRMLGMWIDGRRFRSMQEVTDFLNERYRTTCQFFRDNQLLCRREWKSAAPGYRELWSGAVSSIVDIPEEIRSYDEHLGDPGFRENPVTYLLNMREEERLRYISLISMTIYTHEAKERAGSDRPVKRFKDFMREFGNLLNVYIKYPEDPEVQPLMLMVHMDMNSADFKDDRKRRAYFNDYLRMVVYLWHTNQNGCRADVIGRWGEYAQYFDSFPADPDEPPVPELFLDEAVLNIPDFRRDPLAFLHYQMHRDQCIHFLTMLHASSQTPENAALSALVSTNWIKEPASEAAREMDAYFGWECETQDERADRLEENLRQLIHVWRCDQKNCRKIVKRNWQAYETACGHASGEEALPEDLTSFGQTLSEPGFVDDPISVLRGMQRGEQAEFADFCAALNGRDERDAALFADALLLWLSDSADRGALQQMRRYGGYSEPASGEENELRSFFEKAAVSFKFNYGGFRSRAVAGLEDYRGELRLILSDSRSSSFSQEFRSFDETLASEKYRKHPGAFLRDLSQYRCERFLMFLAAMSGLAPDKALRFASLFKNILFYPNDGLRRRVDTMLGKISADDDDRRRSIDELLVTASQEAESGKAARDALRERWGVYDDLYKTRQERRKKDHWELNEKNVERLFRYVRTGPKDASTVMADDPCAVTVKLLGNE